MKFNLKSSISMSIMIAILLQIFMISIYCNSNINDQYNEKILLKQSCDEKELKSINLSKTIRNDSVNEIISKISAGEYNLNSYINTLESLDIYVLDSCIKQYNSIAKSSPTNLSYNNVIVYYDNWSSEWILSAGVWWINDEWMSDVPIPAFPYVGLTSNVGGLDGVGISLYSTSGQYSPTYLKDTYLYVSAGGGSLATTTHSPTGSINASAGVFHQFQDYAYLADRTNFVSTYLYYGKHISVTAVYSESFTNYHGYARLQYSHTWSSTNINSVAVNLSGNPGFNITYTNTTNKFDTLSPGETIF